MEDNKIKVSYAITVSTEIEELKRLIHKLTLAREAWENQLTSEVVVLVDKSNTTEEVVEFVKSLSEWQLHGYGQGYATRSITKVEFADLNKDFATFKNTLNSLCSGKWIFQLDADEYPHDHLLENINEILDINEDVEVIWVPRVNTVEGLTNEDTARWRWHVTENGWINWPDAQLRLYRNKPEIKWKKPVHEQLSGYKVWSALPDEEQYALYHPKGIDRQRRQNAFYDTIQD